MSSMPVLLAALALASPGERQLVDRVAAVVNDEVITMSEVDAAAVPFMDNAPTEEKKKALYKDVLDQLISERLLSQQIKEANITVTDEDVEAAIQDILKRNKITMDELQAALDQNGTSMSKYKEDLKTQLTRLKIVDQKVRQRVVVPEAEIKAEYEKRTAGEKKTQLVHIRHIFFRWGDNAGPDERQRVLERARQARNRVVNGEAFDAVAKEVSEGPTASTGGDLGLDLREGPAARARARAHEHEDQRDHAAGGDQQRGPRGAAARTPGAATDDLRLGPRHDLSGALPEGGRAPDESLDRRAQGAERDRHPLVILALLLVTIGSRELEADPTNYLGAVALLGPGDVLRLAPGTYRDCLELDGLHGTADEPIAITGPEDRTAVFLGERCDGWTNRSRVIVQIEDSSWLIVRNLELDAQGLPVDGVEAGYGDTPVHHVTIENLYIHDNAVSNQENGISSFATAWDWTIRNNFIEHTGTGIYLGNSTGTDPFIRGTIEDNVILAPRGYGMQIKHQLPRPRHAGMPPDGSATIIRRNLFVKAEGATLGEEGRPNLLVGHLPLEGYGAHDRYLIYANTFFENQTDDEALFQGEGNIDFYDNVLINSFAGIGVWIRPHNDVPRDVQIHENTFLCAGPALVIEGGGLMYAQTARGNAIFSDDGAPAVGPPGVIGDNSIGSLMDARFLLADPSFDLQLADLHPLPGMLVAPPSRETARQDFDGRIRVSAYYGAFAGP